MKRFSNFSRSFLKWLIVLLAVGNLILLFVFDYQIPGLSGFFSSDSETAADAPEQDSETDTDSSSTTSIQINVPSGALIYDGSASLDLMNGVTVTDSSGTVQTDISVFSSIKSGSSRKEKIIEYSATDADGVRVTVERALTLADNYQGPTIEVLGEISATSIEDISSIVSILVSNNQLYADDGFGKDITNSVVPSIKSELNDSGNSVITLSVTNIVNDSYSMDITVPVQLSGPVLRLTADKVTISVGESFNFYNYIASAQDENGNDLSDRISINGSVDTAIPGEYTLEFFCTDSEGQNSPAQTLLVIVE